MNLHDTERNHGQSRLGNWIPQLMSRTLIRMWDMLCGAVVTIYLPTRATLGIKISRLQEAATNQYTTDGMCGRTECVGQSRLAPLV